MVLIVIDLENLDWFENISDNEDNSVCLYVFYF